MTASVNSLFFDAVKTAAGSVKVALPNVFFDPINLESYYQVFVAPGRAMAADMSTTNKQGGFCQVSCWVKEKVGEIKAITMAGTIIAAFPRNTKLKGTDFVVDLVQPAYYSQGLTNNNGWYMVPVTIPYIVHNF